MQPRRVLPNRHVGFGSPLAQSLVSAHRHIGPQPTAPGQPPVDPYDYTPDALYQRTLALGQQRNNDAEAQALQARKQLAIDYGDTGAAPDASTALAAGENPFSRFAALAQNEASAPRNLTNQLNARNLFYSSTFGQDQSNLARQLLQARYDTQGQERQALSGIEQSLLGSHQAVADQEEAAAEAAAQRLQARLGDLPVGQPAAPAPGSPLQRGSRSLIATVAGRRPAPPPVRRPLPRGPHARY